MWVNSKEVENRFKTWLSKQSLPVEAAVVTITSAAQGAAMGGFMGTLTNDVSSSFAPPPAAGNPQVMASFQQAQKTSLDSMIGPVKCVACCCLSHASLNGAYCPVWLLVKLFGSFSFDALSAEFLSKSLISSSNTKSPVVATINEQKKVNHETGSRPCKSGYAARWAPELDGLHCFESLVFH
ncbi:hypothetical protein CTI12_AA602950 [Artemisia annua]|uniref:Uncharacterized protein n=1 Tax=Artemisia annua TaxID=35608 RepID=A0A2U1KH77_ARTAN|nr:hypothetical protein CTI12_AA602950 [Artemisia annua]